MGVAEVLLPTKVRTSPAAETHAVALAVGMTPAPPRLVTDCLGVVRTAERGRAAAVAASRPLAAPWLAIAAATDGDPAAMVRSGRLLWMPAHTTDRSYRGRTKSDGSAVTPTDWRANRFADVVARRCASSNAVTSGVTNVLDDAAEALLHEAATLAACTRAANNHKVHVVTTAGAITMTTKRDSGGLVPPAHVRAAARARKLAATPALPPAKPLGAGPCDDGHTRRQGNVGNTPAAAAARAHARACKRKRVADAAQQAKDEAVALAIVRDRAGAATPSAHCPASRLAALRARVLARQAVAAGGPALTDVATK